MNTTEIRKGDRVEHKTSHKTGTAARDEYESMNGHGVMVFWDDAKISTASTISASKVRKI